METGIDGVSIFKQVGFVLGGLKDENQKEFTKALDDINECLQPYGLQLIEQKEKAQGQSPDLFSTSA